jgi:hypothetical protein
MTTEKMNYHGWPNCYRLTNGTIELIVTTDIGPRVIRFGFVGGENVFKEFPDQVGQTGGNAWRIYGGHRLWHAPEAQPRSYAPDNTPVKLEQHDGFVRLIQPVENLTGLEKEMDLQLAADRAGVQVTHRLTNRGIWPVELAPWALSVMAPGGTGVFPLPPRRSHTENLLPTNVLTFWAYTDFTDPRWTIGRHYVLLRQDPQATTPQKIGASVPDGWAGYVRDGFFFLKKFTHLVGATYPDSGSSVETFTNGDMLEVETLGPLTRLDPGASVEHIEHWFLFRDVPTPKTDADVQQHLLPHVRAATATIAG